MEHYPEQPLVIFSYQETSRKDITKQSQKRKYNIIGKRRI